MIYASKTPRDLNRDPAPYVHNCVGCPNDGHRVSEPCPPFRTVLDPRPEFDPPKAHNEPNPILVEFRVLHQATGNDLFADALMFTSDLMEEFVEREPEHWDHAMRVLRKVLHFSKMTRGTR